MLPDCYLCVNKLLLFMNSGSKKALRQQVESTLAVTFADLKGAISEKKFNKNVKKAGKRLIAGLKQAPAVKETVAETA